MKWRYTGRINADASAVLGTAKKELLSIRIDTREQYPLLFPSDYVQTQRATVDVFDYALAEDNGWSIERKSLADFVQAVALCDNYRREMAKIKKAQMRGLPVVYVCEFSFDDIAIYNYEHFTSGKITPQFIYHRLAELIYVHNVHFIFAGGRHNAALVMCLLLKRRKEHIKDKGKINGKKQYR